jgi:GNAT superfamily N-acetyltransferase
MARLAHEDAPPSRNARLGARKALQDLLDAPAVRGGRGARLEPGAAPALQRFLVSCGEDVALFAPGVREVATLLARAAADRNRHLIGLYDARGEIAAVVDVIRDRLGDGEWTLEAIMVRPDLRGAGVAAALLERVEAWARAAGASALHLSLQRRNAQARFFARRSGFAPVEEERAGYEHLVRVLH